MIYLDHAATAPIHSEVIDLAIKSLSQDWYNPNSIYSVSQETRRKIETARHTVAECIGARADEIIFCPSSSAANTLAVLGYLKRNKTESFVTTRTEHDSILNIEMPIHVKREFVECNSEGSISPSSLEKFKNSLISVIGANNEAGSINPVKKLSEVAHKNNCIIHSDLTQYIPHLKVNVKELDLDMASFSGHKIGGLRGCAVLYVKKGIDLEPLIYGHQEKGLMGGTENTLAIMCMAKAMQLLNYSKNKKIETLRNYAISRLEGISNSYLIGSRTNRLCNNINMCFKDIDAQGLLYYLDLHGIYCSAGSACNSYRYEPSHVLKAMGMKDKDALSCIRITLGEDTSYEDINNLCDYIHNYIKMVNNLK